MTRRLFLAALLWLGLAAPAFAGSVCGGKFDTGPHAQTKCSSDNSGSGCFGSSTSVCAGGWDTYRRDVGTTQYHYAYGYSSCPSGEVFNSGGECVAWCEYDHTKVATDPACVEVVVCPEGQSGNPCAPVGSEPELASGREISVEVCKPPTDCSVQANWTPWSNTVNDGGWIYSASSPSSCTQGESTGIVSCNSNTVYQGAGPATSGMSVAGNTVTGGTNAIQNTCTTGYTYDAALDRCIGSTGGAPATSSTASTAPVTSNSCPVGYAVSETGACVSSAQDNYACPDGYTKGSDGKCSSAAGTVPSVYGTGAGGGANAVSSCGGPGQPACKVAIEGAPDWTTGTGNPELVPTGGIETGMISAVAIEGAPVGQCPDDIELPQGLRWKWTTICDFALFLRPFILAFAWLAAGMFVLGVVI